MKTAVLKKETHYTKKEIDALWDESSQSYKIKKFLTVRFLKAPKGYKRIIPLIELHTDEEFNKQFTIEKQWENE